MQIPLSTIVVLISALALQVSASAPHCELKYENKALHLVKSNGCPPDESLWTHCCTAPFSNYNASAPIEGKIYEA
ncbi:uncharacterized protein MEPE_01875 [Melanopsichium pennsylvanicum]|uniref:Uncharacterized protein n=1 Tax=Melanopsichium pennsylvanicum TaxID=63383 RepID=A0AAJ4XIE2_9BASI|nr:uncharacterized protein MEPE_01875 [Melanopsichium pennsylvanicum]